MSASADNHSRDRDAGHSSAGMPQGRRDAQRGEAVIADEAAQWFMRRDAGLDEEGESALAEWRAIDPRHEKAFARLAGTWAAFGEPEWSGSAGTILQRLAVRAGQRRRRRVRIFATAAAIALLASALPWMERADRSSVAERGVMLQPPPLRKLADGSVVELNSGAEIAVDYSATARRVRLLRGEAHFRVEKDLARPFVVAANGVEVRAVGTAFTVQLQPAAVEVVVTHGSVAVHSAPEGNRTGAAGQPAALQPISAGSRVVVETSPQAPAEPRVESLTTAEIEQRLAWRVPRVEFAGTELAAAVALMNRQNRLQIVLGHPAIDRQRLSGTFRSDNPEGFVRIVQETFDLRVARQSETEIVLVPAAPRAN